MNVNVTQCRHPGRFREFDALFRLAAVPEAVAADAGAEERIAATLDRLDVLVRYVCGSRRAGRRRPAFTLPRGFRLSVVIPVYNERDTILEVIRRVRALPLPTEIDRRR